MIFLGFPTDLACVFLLLALDLDLDFGFVELNMDMPGWILPRLLAMGPLVPLLECWFLKLGWLRSQSLFPRETSSSWDAMDYLIILILSWTTLLFRFWVLLLFLCLVVPGILGVLMFRALWLSPSSNQLTGVEDWIRLLAEASPWAAAALSWSAYVPPMPK